MIAVKPLKSLQREDSFLRKFSNRYGYRGLVAMGKRDEEFMCEENKYFD